MKFIIGKKLDMTQVWQGDEAVAVTRVGIEPCVITQVKTISQDGYNAVQVGTGQKKEKNIKKPQKGHFVKVKQANGEINVNFRKLREFRIDNVDNFKIGDVIDINSFLVGDKIQVTSISKGKGFQGVVKRHGFAGGEVTHGNKDQVRMPGSAGATGPAHVFKGTRMGGRMGGDQVTIKNLEIVEVDSENNILMVRGGISGARNTMVLVVGEGDLKLAVAKEEKHSEEAKKEAEVSENSVKEEPAVAEAPVAEKLPEEKPVEEIKKEETKEVETEEVKK